MQSGNSSTEERTDVEAFLQDVDRQMANFEQDARATAHASEHWRDSNPTRFTASQREHTTILHAGLTLTQDLFIQSTFRGLGYRVEAMEVPDNRALQFGREFGNRGQCNPTYFTVGNLVKKLKSLEASGLSRQHIIDNYLFATAGSCGPCRFGTYVTEYRKALRDSGFEGFRVILFQQAGGIKQATGEDAGLRIDARFFLNMARAIVLGDVLNAQMYRIRPYERNSGETDAAIARARERIAHAFENRRGLWRALWQTRRELAAIEVDKSQVKPRVAIIGEFWAMTTEGDGNYKMQSFLEQEGAEVDIQLVINWILYLLWAAEHDLQERAELHGTDPASVDDASGSKFALRGINVTRKLWMIRAGAGIMRCLFAAYARLLGLRDYHLPDMHHIARISHAFYDNNLRGGEGHMEVGKLIHNVVEQKVNMTLSIKPFGCMPSSAVSDGVQSLITELYPAAIFLPIETNGDGAVNVYSRVQMQLFKARKSAQNEVNSVLQSFGWSQDEFTARLRQNRSISNALYRSPHQGACSAIDTLHALHHRQRNPLLRFCRSLTTWLQRAGKDHKPRVEDLARKTADQLRQRQAQQPDNPAMPFSQLPFKAWQLVDRS